MLCISENFKKSVASLALIPLLFFSCTPKKKQEHTLPKSRSLALVTASFCDVLGPAPDARSKGEGRYKHLACSFENQEEIGWLRVHQLVFNQLVVVLDQIGDETLIEIPHLDLKTTKQAKKEPLIGWVLTKYLLFLNEAPGQDYVAIPNPEHLPFQKERAEFVSLIMPVYSPELKQYFSATTRFVVKKFLENEVICTALHPTTKQPFEVHVPSDSCIKNDRITQEDQLQLYLKVLRTWSHLNRGCIPYILGGASFVVPYPSDFSKIQVTKNLVVEHYYERPLPMGLNAHSGMDCSSLIYLAANVVGLPYDLKNTTAIKDSLPRLSLQDSLEEGDLILLPGHVMIISQLDPLKIIQARGYDSGVGRVEENEAHELFDSVKNIDELLHSYRENKPLIFKNSRSTYHNWEVYKFKSYVFGEKSD